MDRYADFLSWMLKSQVFPHTRAETVSGDRIQGSFEAVTSIGFSLISFEYLSKVTYSKPRYL